MVQIRDRAAHQRVHATRTGKGAGMGEAVNWSRFEEENEVFAKRVQGLLLRRKHMTLATLRKDGAPRISGTEVALVDGELTLGMMPGSLKALDLLRDGRCALHGPTEDPSPEDTSLWSGEVKVAGITAEVPLPEGASGHQFRLLVNEVVLTSVHAGALVVESWHPGRGHQERRRS